MAGADFDPASPAADGERNRGDHLLRLNKYRPRTSKYAAAYLSIAVGVMVLVGGLMGAADQPIQDPVLATALPVLASVVFIVPGIYWLYCNHRDKPAIRHFDATGQTQEIPPRRWWVVALVCLFFALIVNVLLPPLP